MKTMRSEYVRAVGGDLLEETLYAFIFGRFAQFDSQGNICLIGDGGPDGRGVGFYFRNTTELILFGTRGRLRTGDAGRRQVNIIKTQKREHSRKPDEIDELVESCSPGPYLELFARGKFKPDWNVWGDQSEVYEPNWPTYKHNSSSKREPAIST